MILSILTEAIQKCRRESPRPNKPNDTNVHRRNTSRQTAPYLPPARMPFKKPKYAGFFLYFLFHIRAAPSPSNTPIKVNLQSTESEKGGSHTRNPRILVRNALSRRSAIHPTNTRRDSHSPKSSYQYISAQPHNSLRSAYTHPPAPSASPASAAYSSAHRSPCTPHPRPASSSSSVPPTKHLDSALPLATSASTPKPNAPGSLRR